MLKFYFNLSPNPLKVALFLEEAGLDYEAVPVDPNKGEQFDPTYLAINPNAKLPALTDGDVTLFDSNAILLYLAGKTGKFMTDKTEAERAQMLSWLMLVATGVGPFVGQAVHFKHFAPDPKEYPLNRYMYEAERYFGLIETKLSNGRYMLGEIYSIVDMSVWGWARVIPYVFGAEAWSQYPNIKRQFDEISARPAAERAMALTTGYGFKQEMDAEARRNMFPQNARLATV
jgi:GST-like protein